MKKRDATIKTGEPFDNIKYLIGTVVQITVRHRVFACFLTVNCYGIT